MFLNQSIHHVAALLNFTAFKLLSQHFLSFSAVPQDMTIGLRSIHLAS